LFVSLTVLSFAGIRTNQYPVKYYHTDKATYCPVQFATGTLLGQAETLALKLGIELGIEVGVRTSADNDHREGTFTSTLLRL
jgi:hypothetical protein